MDEGGSVQPLQATARHISTALALVAIGSAALLFVAASPAIASPACASAILDDWAGGAVQSTYPLDCYDAAIDALPEDLRAYTTAADDISRAAMTASRAGTPTRQLASAPVAAGGARDVPPIVTALGVFVAVLTAAGLGASVARRRRAR